MRKMTLLLMIFFSLAASADEKLNGGFIVAPILVDGYASYGDCLVPIETKDDKGGYIAGTFITIINAQTITDIKHINAENDNIYYRLESNLLKVFSSARIYTFDGKQICSLTDNSQIDTGTLPDFFIIKFNDGKTFKLQK